MAAALNMRQILEDSRRFVQQKQAEYKTEKAGMVGQAPSSMPGAENDKPAPSVSADKEVKQDLPPGGTSAAGAADAEKVESGQALDATQKGENTPTKEPATSADAMADPKCGAAKLANDLLSSIKALQDSMKAADAPKAEEKKAECAADGDGKKPAEGAAAAPAAKASKSAEDKDKGEAKKAEPVTQITLTQDVLAKVAAVILSTEAGWEFTEQALTKAAGAEAAREVLGTLVAQAENAEKQAAAQQGYADAQALILKAAEQVGYEKAATEMGKANPEQAKLAEMYKLGQAVADDAMAGLAGAEGAGGEGDLAGLLGAGAEGAPAEAGAAELAGMGAEPAGGDITEEELAQALTELVQEGEIQPEDAEAILAYIAQASGAEGMGEAAAGEAPAEAPAEEAGEEAPAEEAAAGDVGEEAAEGDEVTASAKKASVASLMETIKEAKAKRDAAKPKAVKTAAKKA